MSDTTQPKLAKWPFLVGDLLLIGVAGVIISRGAALMTLAEAALVFGAVGLGAVLGALPFWFEYQATARLSESADLAAVMAQFGKVEEVAEEIRRATAQWQGVHGEATRAANAAKEVGEKMTEEARAFGEFMQRANDSEKGTLRLEVEKLRRAEAETLHVLVRLLDHVFALYQAAVKSGQPGLIEQLSHFQGACYDTVRWLGLTPFIAKEGETFDAQRHQLPEGNGAPPADALVGTTLATGYTFQGRLLRPALVRLLGASPTGGVSLESPSTALPLETKTEVSL